MLKEKQRERGRECVKMYIQREKMIGSMCESVNERWCIMCEREREKE